jgi:hypothetical protein
MVQHGDLHSFEEIQVGDILTLFLPTNLNAQQKREFQANLQSQSPRPSNYNALIET